MARGIQGRGSVPTGFTNEGADGLNEPAFIVPLVNPWLVVSS